VVVLSTELTDALISEGLARELVHIVQTQRREMNLEYTARICIGLVTEAPELRAAVKNFGEYIQGETLATQLQLEPFSGVSPQEVKVGDYAAALFIVPLK
jgi:isoleucyl-tRNA synthetase